MGSCFQQSTRLNNFLVLHSPLVSVRSTKNIFAVCHQIRAASSLLSVQNFRDWETGRTIRFAHAKLAMQMSSFTRCSQSFNGLANLGSCRLISEQTTTFFASNRKEASLRLSCVALPKPCKPGRSSECSSPLVNIQALDDPEGHEKKKLRALFAS